jgi:hypothetical protein
MNLADRIEKRRFVGREFLLWLWFESELFEATLSTEPHGSFGMWIEGQLVLSAGRETTRIKGSFPGGGASAREAKEGLLVGKLPEIAGLHLSWRDQEFQFVLRAERLALSGLKLPTVLGGEEEPDAASLAPTRPSRKRRNAPDERDEAHEGHESFYERMTLTRDVESLLEALYVDFLALRLSPAWQVEVAPVMRTWASGQTVDSEGYRAVRKAALSKPGRRAPAKKSGAAREITL